jgi:hypothetical protein
LKDWRSVLGLAKVEPFHVPVWMTSVEPRWSLRMVLSLTEVPSVGLTLRV